MLVRSICLLWLLGSGLAQHADGTDPVLDSTGTVLDSTGTVLDRDDLANQDPATEKAENQTPVTDPGDLPIMKQRVVKIEVTKRKYDMTQPWIGMNSTTHGSGVVIGPGRILTNAHVAIYATELRVQSDQVTRKVDARVVGLSFERDLIPDDLQGRMITSTRDADEDYPLQVNDVLTAVSNRPIDNDGNVNLDARKMSFTGAARLLAQNDEVNFSIFRDGETIELSVPLTEPKPRLLPNLNGRRSSYFLYGPHVFTAATETLSRGIAGMIKSSDVRSRQYGRLETIRMAKSGHPLLSRSGDPVDFEGQQIVIVGYVLKHRSVRGIPPQSMRPVQSVNGTEVKNLVHLTKLLRDIDTEHVRFEFDEKDAPPLILNHRQMMKVINEVMEDNNIRRVCSPDLKGHWEEP